MARTLSFVAVIFAFSSLQAQEKADQPSEKKAAEKASPSKDYGVNIKAAQEAFKKALRDAEGDREKRQKAIEAYRKQSSDLRAEYRKKLEAERGKRAEERQKRLEAFKARIGNRGRGVGQILSADMQQRLKLTDDQKKAIADLQQETKAKLMKMLTEEQRKMLEGKKGEEKKESDSEKKKEE